jgi:hypothetical protein
MIIRVNFVAVIAAILVAVIHFTAGLAAGMIAATWNSLFWKWVALNIYFPMSAVLVRIYAGKSVFTFKDIIFITTALIIQSCCWGILLSFLLVRKKPNGSQ